MNISSQNPSLWAIVLNDKSDTMIVFNLFLTSIKFVFFLVKPIYYFLGKIVLSSLNIQVRVSSSKCEYNTCITRILSIPNKV